MQSMKMKMLGVGDPGRLAVATGKPLVFTLALFLVVAAMLLPPLFGQAFYGSWSARSPISPAVP